MSEAAADPTPPAPIHVLKPTAHGTQSSSGYHAVGPRGQLVKLPPRTVLKPGWRIATQADLDAHAELEAKRRGKDKSGEHADREAQAARAAAKRAAVEGPPAA